MNLAKNLKDLINKKGIKLVALSRQTGVPLQTLHNWLSGMQPKSIEQLKKVADHLGMTVDQLCFDSSKAPKDEPSLERYREEINAGIYEVILRRPSNKGN